MKHEDYIDDNFGFMVFIAIVALIGLCLYAYQAKAGELPCDTCTATTVDALLGDPVYFPSVDDPVAVDTKAFVVPDGYKMVEVPQPDEITCTAYPQPAIWTMVPIAPVVKTRVVRPSVTRDQEADIRQLLEGSQ